jgi:hypothetical protein
MRSQDFSVIFVLHGMIATEIRYSNELGLRIQFLPKNKELATPTICAFYGIIIQMFWNEHAPPHFHVKYAEYKAAIDIETLEIVSGAMPNASCH